jgi:hypothetical protein
MARRNGRTSRTLPTLYMRERMMAYYRFEVSGGEFVLRREGEWQLTFNGVQIGGLHRAPQEALSALARLRSGQGAGPNLCGVDDPPRNLDRWMTQGARRNG